MLYIYIPRIPMTSIFEGQLPKTSPFPTKTRGPIWVPGIYTFTIKKMTTKLRKIRMKLSEKRLMGKSIWDMIDLPIIHHKNQLYTLGCPPSQ